MVRRRPRTFVDVTNALRQKPETKLCLVNEHLNLAGRDREVACARFGRDPRYKPSTSYRKVERVGEPPF